MTIAVIGAGIAGLACAERLVAAGRSVILFDKGRRPGGRVSTRRVETVSGEASFDHGAQYVTVRDPAFAARIEAWRREGLVVAWPAAGGDAYVGMPGMDAPVAAVAARLDVRRSTRVDALERDDAGWRLTGEGIGETAFAAVVVTVPAEQVAALAERWDPKLAAAAVAMHSEPCLTVMAAFPERLAIVADVVRHAGPIGWATRNSAKPGRTGPEAWVIQAEPGWSARHLEDGKPEAMAALLDAFVREMGVRAPKPLTISIHRWRYARAGEGGGGPMWNPALRLGACGDWTYGPRVEDAWLSGYELAGIMLAD